MSCWVMLYCLLVGFAFVVAYCFDFLLYVALFFLVCFGVVVGIWVREELEWQKYRKNKEQKEQVA